jgi:NADP-dependent 3-hydroxy acid dehydrogenase YdfG
VDLEDDRAVMELGKKLAGKVDVLVNNAGAPPLICCRHSKGDRQC